MKADSTGESEPNAATGARLERVADPFAVDLFAATGLTGSVSPAEAGATQTPARDRSSAVAPANETATSARVRNFWHASLPQVTRREAQLSSVLAALPERLAAQAREISSQLLARLVQTPEAGVGMEAVGLRETGAVEWLEARRADASPRLFVAVAIEPEGARMTMEADAAFASSLTALMLGGDAASSATEGLREVSKIERAIIEFLCLTLIQELNSSLGEPVFRLLEVSTRTPVPLDVKEREERLLTIAVRAQVGALSGILRLNFGGDALRALDESANALLSQRRAATLTERLARLERYASQVALHVLVGETEVDALSLVALEAGDVVLVERPEAMWQMNGQPAGELRVRAGDGSSVVLAGEAMRRDAGGASDEMSLPVRSISLEHGAETPAERLSMEEDSAERLETSGEGADVLDALLLTVRVELAARRITLEELARLRAGQILELGCRPTDPVELVAENRRIASGELVDVEGQLGVRITKLWG